MSAPGDTREERPWLRRWRYGRGVDWSFLAYWMLVGIFLGMAIATIVVRAPRTSSDVDGMFGDATIYFSATQVWMSGGDPWSVRSPDGIPFAAPPPALLLNLPLLPFGAGVAKPFWAIAGLVGWVAVVRRLKLAPWWLLFPPFLEAWFAASPDPALAGLAVVGGGAVASISKPYAIPGLLSDGHQRAVIAAVAIGVVTIPLLPWVTFLGELGAIQAAMGPWQQDLTAWGNPAAMIAVGAALATLRPRDALGLAVPGLWPMAQFHYSIFSAGTGARSIVLAVLLAVPGLAPLGIVAYALVSRVLPWAVERWDGGRAGGLRRGLAEFGVE